MASSERKIAANRANAAKSTGPKTPRGKKNSSRNAIRHGILAEVIIIEGESRQLFKKLYKSIEDEYRPETCIEIELVANAVAARWRLNRLWAVETASIVHEQRRLANFNAGEDYPTRAMLALRSLTDNSRHTELMSRYESRLDRQYHRALDRLDQMRAEKNARARRSHQSEENTGTASRAIPTGKPSEPIPKPPESQY